MAAPRDRRHILVPTQPIAEQYTPHVRYMRSSPPTPNANRPAHGAALTASLQQAVAAAAQRRQNANVDIDGAIPSIYIEFQSVEGVPLDISQLEDKRQRIEVVAVSRELTEKPEGEVSFIEHATVVVPEGSVAHFLNRFASYSKADEKQKGERRYENMLDRVALLQLATLRALWTDEGTDFPNDVEPHWWEVWLRKSNGGELDRFIRFCNATNLLRAERRLEFADRIVLLVRARASELALSIDVLQDMAEVRSVHTAAGFFDSLANTGQAEWVQELLARTTLASADAPAVCILDTGVNRGHPLLSDSLAHGDLHACNVAWNVNDHDGHGTEMAGLALYGNLAPICADTAPLTLRHRLESVKVLPPQNHAATPPELYGAVTAAATSKVEIAAPNRHRSFSMSVGADPSHERGQPTSWSAAIDALAAGRSFDPSTQGLVYLDEAEDARARRLFLVTAGNIDPGKFTTEHLTLSDTELIEDPGQAWNALTVGAHTQLCATADPTYAGWEAIAPAGELSPWSRTSVGFDTYWPNKPDVVFEGANVIHNGTNDFHYTVPDLCPLTTHRDPQQSHFAISWATSAACAQVANIAGQVMALYPSYWPETVRGLIVHSARWTDAMSQHLAESPGMQGRAALLRRYGFGVPRLDRALHSATDALTLVVQGIIHPFQRGHMREIHFHTLPWPKAVLATLGPAAVQLRATLSYFIEPNPSRKGWTKKHRYQSHGLRYRIKGPAESLDEFRKRLNAEALSEEEKKPQTPEDDGWFFGSRTRERGSLHSDTWTGTSADLAEREIVAIYPVSGWWKDQKARDRSDAGVRYSLIVSIETPAEAADIWTPVAQQVGVEIEQVIEVLT